MTNILQQSPTERLRKRHSSATKKQRVTMNIPAMSTKDTVYGRAVETGGEGNVCIFSQRPNTSAAVTWPLMLRAARVGRSVFGGYIILDFHGNTTQSFLHLT